MTHGYRPATRGNKRPLFVAMQGGTNSGKSWSALLLARGIAGPNGKVAALDTEAGRLGALADDHNFDVKEMSPPFSPKNFADEMIEIERAEYDCAVIDSFSMVWRGPGGVLDTVESNLDIMTKGDKSKRDAYRDLARRDPSQAHTAMVFSFLQRKIPIVFSIRAKQSSPFINPKTKKKEYAWKPQCQPDFPFELTIALMLSSKARGRVDLDLPHKLEDWSAKIFQHGDLITVEHGAKLRQWREGKAVTEAVQQSNEALLDKLLASVGLVDDVADILSFAERPRVIQARQRLTDVEWGKVDATLKARRATLEAMADAE